jgi:hypothetical protein
MKARVGVYLNDDADQLVRMSVIQHSLQLRVDYPSSILILNCADSSIQAMRRRERRQRAF